MPFKRTYKVCTTCVAVDEVARKRELLDRAVEKRDAATRAQDSFARQCVVESADTCRSAGYSTEGYDQAALTKVSP